MTKERIFSIATVVVVAAGLVLAFMYIGSPGYERQVALDRKRLQDLIETSTSLHERYGVNPDLPKRLPPNIERSDPLTQRPYEYHRLTPKTYMLCAVFALPMQRDNENDVLGPVDSRSWHHNAGHSCYRLDVRQASPYPSYPY